MAMSRWAIVMALVAFAAVTVPVAHADEETTFITHLRCGNHLVIHEIQPTYVGGIRFRGGAIFRISGPHPHVLSIFQGLKDTLDAIESEQAEEDKLNGFQALNDGINYESGHSVDGADVEGNEDKVDMVQPWLQTSEDVVQAESTEAVEGRVTMGLDEPAYYYRLRDAFLPDDFENSGAVPSGLLGSLWNVEPIALLQTLLPIAAAILVVAAMLLKKREEEGVVMVLNTPDHRTPLLQTYVVDHNDAESNGVNAEVEHGVVLYQPPEAATDEKK